MSLESLVHKLVTDGPVNVASASGRRIRALLNGSFIIDTTDAVHVWEHASYPQYYVPSSALKSDSKVKVEEVKGLREGNVEVATVLRITVGSRSTQDAVRFEDVPACGKLRGLVKLVFQAVDQWYEEDTPVYVHPKDPTKRIDILPSSRRVEVQVGGHVVASTTSAVHLIEPLLPVRYYLPKTCVDPSLLRESRTRSLCPYKGEAEYYDVVVEGRTYRDLVWWYRYTTHECTPIAGMLCFYNERVDVVLDGQKLARPTSKFA